MGRHALNLGCSTSMTSSQGNRVKALQPSKQQPHWPAVAEMILLVQPSSAADEWAFSLLKNLFGVLLNASLGEYLQECCSTTSAELFCSYRSILTVIS